MKLLTFDYVFDVGGEELGDLFTVDKSRVEKKVLKDKKSQDRHTLYEAIETAMASNDVNQLQPVWEYIKSRHRSIKGDLDDVASERVERFFTTQASEGRFFLRRGK